MLHALNGLHIYAGEYKRQAIFAAIGVLLSLGISRFDYSRLREFRYVVYGLMIGLNLAVFAFATPGGSGVQAQRRIPVPGFSFQSSAFGMLLLILALSAFAVERSRRMSEHRTTARILLLALVPAMIVMRQSDLGDALIYVLIAVADPVLPGHELETPGSARGARHRCLGDRADGRAGARRQCVAELPEATSDHLYQPPRALQRFHRQILLPAGRR